MVDELGGVITDINQSGVSVLSVDQNVPLALRVASMGYALHIGRVVLEGGIDKFKDSEIVKRAYLGG